MNIRTLKADSLLLLTAAIWGAAFVAQRVGMDHVGPMTFNAVRFALGALALAPMAARSGGPLRPGELTGWVALGGGFLAGLALFLGATFQQVGIIWTTAGKAGFITGLYVVIVPLLGLFFRQRPGFGCWLGAGLATIGMYLLSVTESFTIGKGDLLVLICAFMFAGHVLVIGWLAPRMNPVRLACFQFATCSALSFAVAIFTEEIAMASIMQAGIPILYGGVMSVGVAYTLQVVAQQDAPPAHAAIILSLEGMFAAVSGWFLLGETLDTRSLIGCGLMLAGMLSAQLLPGGELDRESG